MTEGRQPSEYRCRPCHHDFDFDYMARRQIAQKRNLFIVEFFKVPVSHVVLALEGVAGRARDGRQWTS